MKFGTPIQQGKASSDSSYQVSNDAGNTVDAKGPRIDKANPPVAKSEVRPSRSLWHRFIQIVKPDTVRRKEIDKVWKQVDQQVFEVMQAVRHAKSKDELGNASDAVIATLKPLLRAKEGGPALTHLLGLRVLKQIRDLDEDEVDALSKALKELQSNVREDPDSSMDRITNLIAFSIDAERFNAQVKAFEVTFGKKLSGSQHERLAIGRLPEKQLQELRKLKDAASALVDAAKAYTPRDGVLPGTRLKLDRLQFVHHYALTADEALSKRDAYFEADRNKLKAGRNN